MMGNPRRFAALNTKIRALKGSLLKDSDFINLMSKDSIEGVALYLKNDTNYREVLEGTNVEDIRRGELEPLLKKYIVVQFEKLIHYFTDDYNRLFKTIFARFEIEDLKIYLRAISRGEDITKIVDFIDYPSKYGTLDYEVLSSSRNVEEFIENLKGTKYYDVLKPYLNEENRKLLFYMEMNLDRLYFRMLKEDAGRLEGDDKKLFEEILGKNIDLLNIEWIYRGIKYYNLLPEELINYTLLGGHEFKYKDVKELCYLRDVEKFKEAILNSKYAFLFDTKGDVDLFMERRIERYMYFEFLKYLKMGKMDITVSAAYIHLLEYEVRDLISTIEAVRYKLGFDEASKYLIRRVEGRDA